MSMDLNVKKLVLILSVTSILVSVYADDLITVKVKNGETFCSSHVTPHNWGIYLENGEAISYKVVTEISTSSRKLLDSLVVYVSELEVREQDGFYKINFHNARLPKVQLNDDDYIKETTVDFIISSNYSKKYNLIFSLKPNILNELNFYTGVSFGDYYKSSENVLNRYVVQKKVLYYKTFNFLVGIGFEKEIYNSKIGLFAQYMVRNQFLDITEKIINNDPVEPARNQTDYNNSYNQNNDYSLLLKYKYKWEYLITLNLGIEYLFNKEGLPLNQGGFFFHFGLGYIITDL